MAAKRREAKKKAPLTFEEWKEKAGKFASDELAIDIWYEGDPFEVAGEAVRAFKAGQGPKEFIKGVFEEDFAGKAYDEHLFDESLIANSDCDE